MVWCPIMLFARDLPRVAWGGKWVDAFVGWIGGIMGGLGGLTGPAPILWATCAVGTGMRNARCFRYSTCACTV